jgi:hemerythrin-like domain-containing protein
MADTSLSAFFTTQHREADSRWEPVEQAAESGDAKLLSSAFASFEHSLRQHLLLEEEVLFPAFEEATGIVQGPTMVMRAEHRQMRALLDEISAALDRGECDAVLDTGDTLLTMIAQHNMKEEAMLYRMCEQALAARWPELLARAANY